MLVGRDDVGINARSTGGLTPLFCVAGIGHKSIVQLLVERGDADIDARDRDGADTSLAGMEHESIVQLLVERGDIDINAKDNGRQTPVRLLCGSWSGEVALG